MRGRCSIESIFVIVVVLRALLVLMHEESSTDDDVRDDQHRALEVVRLSIPHKESHGECRHKHYRCRSEEGEGQQQMNQRI